MNEYRMSSAGACPLVIVARKLGHDPIPPSPAQLRLMEHATRHEELFADYFTKDTGIELVDAGLCKLCKEEFGDERYGHHVEIKTGVVRMIGHVDRVTSESFGTFPVEIKSLGRFGFAKFINDPFTSYYESYIGQEALYIHYYHRPGLYIVGNRDTGDMRIYNIGYHEDFTPYDFPRITLPASGGDFLNKHDDLEINFVQKEILPAGVKGDSCNFCNVRFLCFTEESVKEEVTIVLPSILEATKIYKDGDALVKQGKEMKDEAKPVILKYAKDTDIAKFRTQFASVVYRGLSTKKILTEASVTSFISMLGFESDEGLPDDAYAEGKPYEDIGIYPLKEKNAINENS